MRMWATRLLRSSRLVPAEGTLMADGDRSTPAPRARACYSCGEASRGRGVVARSEVRWLSHLGEDGPGWRRSVDHAQRPRMDLSCSGCGRGPALVRAAKYGAR